MLHSLQIGMFFNAEYRFREGIINNYFICDAHVDCPLLHVISCQLGVYTSMISISNLDLINLSSISFFFNNVSIYICCWCTFFKLLICVIKQLMVWYAHLFKFMLRRHSKKIATMLKKNRFQLFFRSIRVDMHDITNINQIKQKSM